MLDRMVVGEVPRKHHIALRDPAGGLRFEECITRRGFDGPYTIAYHVGRPHTARSVGAGHGWAVPGGDDDRPLVRRHFKSQNLSGSGAPVNARVPLMYNADIVISVSYPDRPDWVYFSNGDADELVFVFEGSGVLRSMLGDVRFEQNDYVFVPKGILHRFIPDVGVKQHWLSIECLGSMGVPKQWRNEVGQLRMDAPFCHRDFRRAEFQGPLDEGIRAHIVKQGGQFYQFEHDNSPLDVVGWDGTVYPWVFPILNFQPRAGLVHLPPDWHGTFAARNALICSFVPRVTDFHPEAIPCPYPHSSVDCDELLFYCRGNFTSRRGVAPGSISLHPMGIAHGPHPGSYERSIGTHSTDELAVMIDTFAPLMVTSAARGIEDMAYHDSFR